jgi:F-type H+-transporting ATPase subunit b
MHFLFAAAEHGAEAAEKSGNILTSLGIDWKLFISQTIAFAILMGILAKFVYPVLIKSIEDRRAAIEAGLEEAKKSQEASEEAEKRIEELLVTARKEADEIVARSHNEAQSMVAEAETKAKQRAERIVADARTQLDAEVNKARAVLKKDTLKLVALATEKVVQEKLDASKDAKLIEQAVAGSAKEPA